MPAKKHATSTAVAPKHDSMQGYALIKCWVEVQETLFTDLHNSYICFRSATQLQFCKEFFKPAPENGFVNQITKRKRRQKSWFCRQKQHIIVWEECKYVPLSPQMNFLLKIPIFGRLCFLKHHLLRRER